MQMRKRIITIIFLGLIGCKANHTTVKTYSLNDSTTLEYKLPYRALKRVIQAENRTVRTVAKYEAKTGQIQIKEQAKTERIELRQNKAITRALVKSDTKIAKSKERSKRAIPNLVKWVSILIVIVAGVFVYFRFTNN
jgi:cobalamin biosynthesis Mg chelatase CobN